MNHTNDFDNLKDSRAERRELKKKPRMRKHGQSLKKQSLRSVRQIHKLTKRK